MEKILIVLTGLFVGFILGDHHRQTMIIDQLKQMVIEAAKEEKKDA